jgi:hypothetical protein
VGQIVGTYGSNYLTVGDQGVIDTNGTFSFINVPASGWGHARNPFTFASGIN